MRTKLFFIAFIATALTITGCEKLGKGDINKVSDNILKTFSTMYPNATNVYWSIKGDYAKASFYMPETKSIGKERNRNAWFNNHNGEWGMTETEIRYQDLPQAIRDGFESSQYAKWEIEEIDRLERAGIETVYVIEVENREMEYDLYFSEDGILIKEAEKTDYDDDDYFDHLPGNSFTELNDYIETHYPGARILEIDRERNHIVVEIIHENREKDVYFSTEYIWIFTETEIRYNELPDAVKNTLQSNYPGAEMDDISMIETPEETYYIVEMEINDRDVEIRISENGTIMQ